MSKHNIIEIITAVNECPDGKVDAIPHIAPAEEHGNQMLEDLIRKALT